MSTTELLELWSKVEKLLRDASSHLPKDDQLRSFEESLEHNELELAWDVLAEVGEQTAKTRHAAPADFWQKLGEAATLMHLPAKRREADEWARKSAQRNSD